MLKRWFPWLCLALIVYGGYDWFRSRRVYQTEGMAVAEAPLQTTARGAAFDLNGVSVSPQADYEIRALVLGIETYRFDEGAAVAPLDVAVGWGPMSDAAVLGKLNISQGNRWYYFRSKAGESLPLSVDVLSRYSANMHLIPANQEINTQLKRHSGIRLRLSDAAANALFYYPRNGS